MDNKRCKYCATMIPKAAKVCPNCGKTLGWTWPAKIVILLIIFGAIASIFSQNDTATEKKVAAPPPTPPPIEITSEQLYDEYNANEIAADQKYKGRALKVTGEIRSIGKTLADTPYINLSTGRWTHQVMVTFPSGTYDDKLASQKRGDRVSVTGTCGGMTLGMVGISLR